MKRSFGLSAALLLLAGAGSVRAQEAKAPKMVKATFVVSGLH